MGQERKAQNSTWPVNPFGIDHNSRGTTSLQREAEAFISDKQPCSSKHSGWSSLGDIVAGVVGSMFHLLYSQTPSLVYFLKLGVIINPHTLPQRQPDTLLLFNLPPHLISAPGQILG